MKKYFSLIAVAMVAVSSVFTSCSKDEAGSSYNPDLSANKNTPVLSSTSSTDSKSETVTLHVQTTLNSNATTTTLDVNKALASFFNTKIGSTGTASADDGAIKFNTSDKEALKVALKAITNDEIHEVVKKYGDVKTLTMSIIIGFDRAIDFTYRAVTDKKLEGTFTATYDNVDYVLNITSEEADGSTYDYKLYKASLTIDGVKYEGTVKDGTFSKIFVSDSKTKRLADVVLKISFYSNDDSKLNCELTMQGEVKRGGMVFKK